jgi:hypothetical protein
VDRPTATVSQLVRLAVEAVDPGGQDPAVSSMYEQLEDDDEAITAVENLEERLAIAAEGADHDVSDPGVTLLNAVVLYLASHGGNVDYDRNPEELIRLAVRAQWHGDPPSQVVDWLAERGV